MRMSRLPVSVALALVFATQYAAAMKCVLQSRDLHHPGWWNLYPLMKTLDANPYQMTDNNQGYSYFFNVCDNTNRCLNGAMAACQVSQGQGGREFDVGMEHWGTMTPMTQNDMKQANEEIGAKYNTDDPVGVKITYHNGEDGRKSHILFPCDASAGAGSPRSPVKNDVEPSGKTYVIVFPSQHGCLEKNAPKIPQSLLGSTPLDKATMLQYEECKQGSVWTHIWAVTTLFALTAATYFWWRGTILERELAAARGEEYGAGYVAGSATGGRNEREGIVTAKNNVSYQQVPPAARSANTDALPEDLPAETTTATAWPPTSKTGTNYGAGYQDL